MLSDVGVLEKLGAPLAIDEAVSAVATPLAGNGAPQPPTNTYGQGQQVQRPQQVQQARPSQ